MTVEMWSAFLLATAVLTLIPGPCVLLLVGQALSRGMAAAFTSILGILLGDVLLMLLSLVGLGAVLGTSALLFQAVKWAGVLYMAFLGYRQISEARNSAGTAMTEGARVHLMDGFRAGFLSAALNPKGIMFFLAFLPQFMDPSADPVPQVFVLVTTSVVVIGSILAGYVLAAARVRRALQSNATGRYIRFVAGGSLLGGSLMMAVVR